MKSIHADTDTGYSLNPLRHARRLLRGDRGISTTEFALALPVLLLLVFGLIETGYLFFASASMDKAAQAGARVAVTGAGADDGTRVELIKNKIMTTLDAFSGKGTISVEVKSFPQSAPGNITTGAGGPCDIVEVNVEYVYASLTPIVGPIFGPSITVHGTDRMVNEPWRVCE
ncbi:pilus assembly protein [Desulfovibrio mangrovi]|uniref:TadE/TadG family type IV pilus assembly protein n=1 Tax=Desulfovibrio mangrovi TaxID=2976983 RepID=UPI002246B48B|nr:TadE/TadG family type IV pilus assembly protein [Desulfovibrio mangrovi]UZP65910.1 pilus assembly protein [Desulfovibrio mangrovi]